MSSGLDWQVFHPGQHAGPYGRVVPTGRVVLDIAPADEPRSPHTVLEQSPEQILEMLTRIADEVRPDAHALGVGRAGGW